MNTAKIDYNIEKVEKTLVNKCLEANKGNVKDSAKDLGISRGTLYLKIKRYQIDLNEYRESSNNG